MRNGLLKKVYLGWYRQMRDCLYASDNYSSPLSRLRKHRDEVIVELGEGGNGWVKEIMPLVFTSDVQEVGTDMCFSAMDMIFGAETIDAFLLINVLHHLRPETFFNEALRCLKPGGKILIIEPANTRWSRLIYRFHFESFRPDLYWEPVNNAMAWILFFRDVKYFKKLYPQLEIINIKTHTSLAYLLAGGHSYPQLVPTFLYPVIKWLEKILPLGGMFYTIVLEKE